MAHASILDIEPGDYEYLQCLCKCRTIQAQIVDRAKILIYKAQGESNTAIDLNRRCMMYFWYISRYPYSLMKTAA